MNLEKPEAMAEFIISEIGGIWAGLWKKEIILDNNLFFPEHLKYEDNYWRPLISLYLKKIALVHDFGYFYRYNPTSTVHDINPLFLRDRITIENNLLNETKRRGIFTQYYSSWEYIYTFRYAFNTCIFAASRRIALDYELVKKISADFNYNFPSWRKNKYYIQYMPLKRKVFGCLFAISPILAVKIYRIFYRLRDCAKNLMRFAR